MKRRKHKVTLVYKSGAVVTIRCADFTVKRRGGEITAVEWVRAKPGALVIGIDDLAAVFST